MAGLILILAAAFAKKKLNGWCPGWGNSPALALIMAAIHMERNDPKHDGKYDPHYCALIRIGAPPFDGITMIFAF